MKAFISLKGKKQEKKCSTKNLRLLKKQRHRMSQKRQKSITIIKICMKTAKFLDNKH